MLSSLRSLRQRWRRRAFTLLELLVSVVVIGILAALAIIKFGSAQEKAYVATMQSDLRNFATARALYISESDQLPGSAAGVPGYSFSELVFEAGYQEDSATEWALLVGHNKTETRCALATYETGGGAHRIACAKEGSTSGGETSALAFFPSSNGNEVTVDASGPISQMAFSGSASFAALNAASVAEIALISWEFGDGTVKSGPPVTHLQQTHTYARAGTYTIQLTLLKKTGEIVRGESQVSTDGAPAVANRAPVASFSVNPMAPEAGQQVTFTATSTDADGDAMTHSWSIGGQAASGASTQVTFSAAGTYSVSLTSTDSKGASTAVTQNVVVNQAPTASFVFSPASVNVGNTVTFDGGASTDADGTIASWTWESAAWSPAKTGSTASHTFNTSGTFQVKLTVTDDRGATHSSTQSVSVQEVPTLSVTAGLEAWLSAGHGVTANSGKVSQWKDLSGRNMHASQTTAGAQPSILQDAQGRTVIRLDGADDFLQFPAGFSDFSQGVTMFVVANPTTTAAWIRFLDLGNGPDSDNVILLRQSTTSYFGYYAFNGASYGTVTSNQSLDVGTMRLYGVVHQPSGAVALYKNGSAAGTGSFALPRVLSRSSNFIGKSNWPDALFQGDFAEVIIYNRALSETERAQVETDLRGRWNF